MATLDIGRYAAISYRFRSASTIMHSETEVPLLVISGTGTGLPWHVQRTVVLEAILVAAAVHDFEVLNEARSVRDVALEVLGRAGWLAESATLPRD